VEVLQAGTYQNRSSNVIALANGQGASIPHA
jgi:hypothetical protein